MSKNNLPKTRILVADDDQTLLDMYKERLESSGHEVIIANNGEIALSRVIETHPHVILLGVIMSRINGFDVLNIIKTTSEIKHIPVIIFTTLAQEHHKQRGIAGGAHDYIVKSEVMPREVIRKIEKIIAENKKKIEQMAQ